VSKVRQAIVQLTSNPADFDEVMFSLVMVLTDNLSESSIVEAIVEDLFNQVCFYSFYLSCDHRKCSGIKGSTCIQSEMSFVCRGCVNPVAGTGRRCVRVGVNANLELVDKFCYLGDTLSVDGDADAAVENRI